MIRIRNRNGFRFISTLLICMICFEVSIQRQVSQGYERSSYSTVGHDGTLNGQLTDTQKHILENGGRTIAHDGRPENIQPLRAGGEDPLRLRLVFMAEVSNSGKDNSSANQPTKSEQPTTQEVQSHASNPSPLHLRVSDQFSPHGDIVRLDSQGILVAQKRRNQAPVPHRTSDDRRVPTFRTGSVIPSPLALRTPEVNRDPPKAEARRYKEEAPRPIHHQGNSRMPPRSRNMFKPLSPQSPGFTPLERLTDRNETKNTNPDPPRRPERQRDPATQHREPAAQSRNSPTHSRETAYELNDPINQPRDPPIHSRDRAYQSRDRAIQSRDRVYQENKESVAARSTGDPYVRQQSRQYPPRNDRYRTRSHVNEGTQVRQLGKILSNMGHRRQDPAGHTRQDPAPQPSRHADSRPYPIQYTIPDNATPTEMRVRRVKQTEASRAQQIYLDDDTGRVRVRAKPTTQYQDDRQQVNSKAIGKAIAIPDTYSDRVRAPPQPPHDSGRFEQPQQKPTEVRAARLNTDQIPQQYYKYQQPATEVKPNNAQIPRQPYQQSLNVPNPNNAQTSRQRYRQPTGEPFTNTTEELVVLSMQENADGTITYTVADRRKANVNNVPLQVNQPTSAVSNSNGYDQPRQQRRSYHHYNVQQSPSEPTYAGSPHYSDYSQRAQNNQTYTNDATRILHTASQYDPYQRPMEASAYSGQIASQTQIQQNNAIDTFRYDTVRPQEPVYQGRQTQPYQDPGTNFNSGAETHISSIARDPLTYTQSVTPPTSEASRTEAPIPMHGNFTIDDGVVYRITKGNNSAPIEVVHTPTDKLNATVQAPSAARHEPSVHTPGEIRVEPSRPGNPRSYVLRENGGYAFRRESVPSDPNPISAGQQPSTQVNVDPGSQVGVSIQATTPSSQSRSNLQILKDIVKISGGKAALSQLVGPRSNTASSSPVTQQRFTTAQPSSGNPLVEAAKEINKIQVLKTLECIPVSVSNNAPCQSSCLPFYHCVTAGSLVFCCPPFVTEAVVQFKMMQRTVEGMSDSL